MDIRKTAAEIEPLDGLAQEMARKRQNELTKPPGSLGRLEELSIQLAGIYRTDRPEIKKKLIFTMAADHGICSEGVSAYPSEVTAQMILNFAAGGAAINVLARHVGAEVITVDIGVASNRDWPSGIIQKKVQPGTKNMAKEPAMCTNDAITAIAYGFDLALNSIEKGANLIGIGDMGIGNTTTAAAITAIMTGEPVRNVTGRGTGLDDEGLEKKIEVIERVISLRNPVPSDPLDVLVKIGGFEIAGMTGVILAAARKSVPVVLDGFISGASALLAAKFAPMSRDYMIASHRSIEIGHSAILRHLELEPILDLGMRLGEGSGAALAMPIIDAACKILNEMATFENAGISNKKEE